MPATYRRPYDDGAGWKCTSCEKVKPHTEVWACETPHGKRRIICEDCLDDDWKELATELPPMK